MTSLRQAILLVAGTGLLATCQPKKYELDGTAPVADFSVTLDTSQFPVVATFTNLSTDAFLYQWDFGDGSDLVAGKTVTHTYTLPRTYQVKLLVAGRGGSATSPVREVTVPSGCGNLNFAGLVDCGGTGTGFWTYSDQPGAVKTYAADGVTLLSATGTLPDCQADDQFNFSNSYVYTYDAGLGCTAGSSLSGVSNFSFRVVNGVSQLTLLRNRAFIGLPDSVRNKTYDVVEATGSLLRLRGTRPDGTQVEVSLVHPLPPLQRVERLLTGGSSRTWVLDNTVANTITVGTEAAPTSYYAGGALGSLPACQADDEYTFSTAHNFIYDAKAETFVAGVYACQAPRSRTTAYVYGQPAGAGLAQLVLAAPGSFIGATDAAADRTYRILSINTRQMVLRAGAATADPVFTLKLRVR